MAVPNHDVCEIHSCVRVKTWVFKQRLGQNPLPNFLNLWAIKAFEYIFMQLRVPARIDGQVLDLQPTGYNNLSQYVFIVYDKKYNDYFLSIQLCYLLRKKGMK